MNPGGCSCCYGVQGLPIVSIVVPYFGINQLYIKDPIRKPQKGTTMGTIGQLLTLITRFQACVCMFNRATYIMFS